jgi:TetR/AcrR family transcriptional regulator
VREHRRNAPGHHRAVVAERLGRGPRLPAAERRDAIIETATRVFAERGFRRATTAEIAAEAGISEPILYRHFMSKVELFLACLESAWTGMLEHWTAAIEEEADGSRLIETLLDAQRELRRRKPYLAVLLVQGLADAAQDPAINAYMRKHVRRVHELMTRILTAAQEAGALPADRDPAAEAWTHMGVSFVSMMAGRLGVMTDAEVEGVTTQRRRWLTGEQGDNAD